MLAVTVGEQAGALLLAGLKGARVAVATKTSPTDVVTGFDHRAEALIVEALTRARPDDGVLAEEGSSRPSRSGVRWIVDPLDGTVNFLYGQPGWGVSIAAELDGELVAGVVVDPVHGETFRAVVGGGATRNGVPIRVNPVDRLEATLVATGFSYRADRRTAQATALQQVLPRVRDIRRAGAASVDLCSVACGRVDAYYEELLNPWDFAAGVVIAREAGALVTDGGVGEPSTRLCVAAAPGVNAALCALLREAGVGAV